MRLTVKQLKSREPGSGMAVIDREALSDIGVASGDFVAIEGRDGGRAVARVWPSDASDAGRGIIRIDGQLRQAAGVSIDDRVEVEATTVEPAERVTVALPQNLRVRGDLGSHLRKHLADQAVTAGQTVAVPFGLGSVSAGAGRRVPLTVVETEPRGTVVIENTTDIQVAEESAESASVEAGGTDESVGAAPTVTYEDVGGLDDELEQVREMIELPMRHPELFQTLGIEPPKGVLLHGPPGTGKTLIARAVANEIDAHFQTISGPEIMSKYYGESEEQLREVFEEAEENAPAIVFIDELDSIAPKREEVSGDVERRVVAQLLSLMDGLEERGRVTVIGTTNRVDAVDPALRRPGRFDREIEIGVPDRAGREEILQIHTRGMPLGEDVDLDTYAEHTQGFVGADLENLTKEAAMTALRRIRPELDLDEDEIPADVLDTIEVTADDFKTALRGIEPSALREVFVEVPDVTWDDVGGLEEAKERLRETVQWPLEHGDAYERVGLEPAKGVLLHGPPGTGKTLLAKAVANEADSNFISIKGPELFDKYVGERVVSQLLTELDGLEELEDVVVIATTNRPDLIDDALLRPGRLDRHVAVEAPDADARREIFAVHTRDKPLGEDVDLDDLAARTDGYVGADIEAVCREAAQIAVREHVHDGGDVEEIVVTADHFERALDEVEPQDSDGSVTDVDADSLVAGSGGDV